MTSDTLNTIQISANRVRCEIDLNNGGRLSQLTIAGLDLLQAIGSNPLDWGAYPMVPWVGRLRNGKLIYNGRNHTFPLNMPPHAIHGTCFDRPWEIKNLTESQVCLHTSLGDKWPFTGYSQQLITISENALNLQLSVHSEKNSFPASIGWHPWFLRKLAQGKEAQLNFKANKKYACDETQIPTGEFIKQGQGPWDDCFTEVVNSPSITWEGALKLEINSNCDHWVVYDKPEHALCIEPQTAAANALNDVPYIVTPDKPLCAEMTLKWQLL